MEVESEGKNESEVSRFALDGIVAEMVIEVDEEVPISPSKTLKLNGLENYNALKASALRKSSVTLESKLDVDESDIVEKEKEIESENCSKISEDMQESNPCLKSSVFEHDKSELDVSVKDTTETDVECINEKSKDSKYLEDMEFETKEKHSEILSETVKEQKCDSSKENMPIVPEKNSKEDHDSAAEIELESETSNGKQIESKISCKASKDEGTKDSDEKESLVSEMQLEKESVVEEDSSKKSSSRRTKSKEVKEERETRSSSNQLRKSELTEVISAASENKRKSLRIKPNVNVKSVLPKAKLTAQNKETGKVATNPDVLKRASKRKLQDPPKEEPVKKQKQTEIPVKTKLRQKSVKSTPRVSEAAVSRRQSLRKVHPAASPAVKLKVFNLYPKSDTRLESFVEVKEQLNVTDLKYLRALYRLMYDRWPPKDLEDLKREILQFQGFTFNRKSDELEKRQQVLKRLPDATVLQVCKMLDLKEGTKDNMISDIIKFLLKPIKIIHSVVDPYHPSMQPVVKLEKMSFDDDNFGHSVQNSGCETKNIKMSKRKKFPSSRLNEYVSTSDASKTSLSAKIEAVKTEKKRTDSLKRKANNSESADSMFISCS